MVRGGDGMGVTRLLEEARQRALHAGMGVGFTTASAGDRLVPLGQLLEAVQDLTSASGGTRARGDYQALVEIQKRLHERSAAAPVLLCLDDFQLSDPESFAGVRHLAAELAGRPVGWVLGVRGHAWPWELESTWSALERDGARHVTLTPLDPEAVGQIATDYFGRPAGASLRALLARAGGNAGLLAAQLRGLGEGGFVIGDDEQVELLRQELPALVRDLVRDRLQDLSPTAQEVLRAVAALGPTCTFPNLTAMLEIGAAALLASLDELVQSGVVSTSHDRILLMEPLVGDAVIASLAPSLCRALQRQAADVLVSQGGEAAEIAARLLASVDAGDEDAAGALLDASQRLGALDPSVAADVGSELLERVSADDPLYGAIAVETAVLLHGAGRHARATAVAEVAFGNPMPAETEGRLRSRVVTATGLSGHDQAQVARLALARPGLSAALKRRLRVSLLAGLAGAGAIEEARLVAKAVTADDAPAVDRTHADDAARRAHALAAVSYVHGAIDSALELLREAEAHHPTSDATRATVDLARSEALSMRQPPDDALALSTARVLWARRTRQTVAARLWHGLRGRQLLHAGRLAEAAEELGVIFSPQPNVHSSEDAAALVAFARVSAHLGRPEDLAAAVTEARRAATDPSPEIRRQVLWLLGTAAGDRGGPADLPELPRNPADVADPARLVRVARSCAIADEATVAAAVAVAVQRRDATPASALLAAGAQHAGGCAPATPWPCRPPGRG